MKKTVNSQQIRWKAIVEIMAKYSTSSPSEIADYLKSEYGIDTTRQTVHRDLQKDLESLTSKEIDGIKSQMLAQIDDLISIAYNRATTGDKDSLKAMGVYNKLIKTKAEIINKFHEFKLKLKEEDRPIYRIIIGTQKEVEIKDENKNTK